MSANRTVNSPGKIIHNTGSPKDTSGGRDLNRDATNTIKRHGTSNIHSEVSPGSTANSANKSFRTEGQARSS